MSDPAESSVQNLLPVQAYFDTDGNFQTFIGQNKPFYATVNPEQSGLHITNSTIDSTTIGATTPSTGVFTNISTTTGTISTAPTGNTDIVNKLYVDSIAQGLNPKQAVKCATTANITLSGLQTIDGYTTLLGDRVLVKNQTNSAENGIYNAGLLAWTRSTDMDVWSEVPGSYTVVLNGSANLDTAWVCTASDSGTIGVTAMPWVQFSGSGTYYAGTGLTLASNTFSITNTGVTAGSYGSASNTIALGVNAQGQLTSVSATPIAIAASQITSGTISSSLISGSYTGITGVGTLSAGTWNANTIGVAYGGTGATTFTAGYLKASGTSAFSTVSTIPNTDITGLGTMSTQDASNVAITGGSAALTTLKTLGLTGYLYGNDTSAVTASTTIPSTAITGLGTMSTQNANSVNITGGTVTGLTNLGADYLQLNTGASVTPAVGKVWWDGGTTLNLGMTTNVTQKVGEDQFYYAKASSAITKGQVCMFTGSVGASGVITAAPATGLTDGSYIVGIAAEDIANNAFGVIQSFGVLRNVNTSGYADGDILWYNPAVTGGLTKTQPSAPNVKVQMAAVINGGSAGGGSIQIRVNSGSVLGGTDSNVQFSTLSNNNLIQYDSANQYWKNVAPSTVSVGTATNLAGGGAGYVPYQSGSGTTSFLSAGTIGQVLTSNGTGAPTWSTPASAITISDDTTTNATRYPLFANQTTGSASTEYVSSTKLQFNPSTGVFTSTSFTGAGTGLTGTASGLSIGGNAATATSATTATNLAGGANGSVPYQTGSGTTTFLAAGTNGYVLTLAGGVPTWAAAASSGLTITDDTTTNATRYLTFTSATSGTITGENTSSTKLQFNPSTGALSATDFVGSIGATAPSTAVFTTLKVGSSSILGNSNADVTLGLTVRNSGASTGYLQTYNSNAGSNLKTWRLGGNSSGNLVIETVNDAYSSSTNRATLDANGNLQIGGGIFVNSQTISSNYTIASGSSGSSAGPVTISSGVTVTVSSGSKWVVL
jgi:hypothetical protein